MLRAQAAEAQWHQETESAEEFALAGRFRPQRLHEQLSISRLALPRRQAIGQAAVLLAAGVPVELLIVVAELIATTLLIATEIAAPAVRPAQIFAKQTRTRMPSRKSRQAQPSATASASPSSSLSHEKLFLSPRDFIVRYCCGPKFRMAAAACRRM